MNNRLYKTGSILALLVSINCHSAFAKEATEFLQFKDLRSLNCVTKGGVQKVIVNNNKQQMIEVHVDRYFSGVRQAGRSIIELAANGGEQALGCSRVLSEEQRWEIVKAKFR